MFTYLYVDMWGFLWEVREEPWIQNCFIYALYKINLPPLHLWDSRQNLLTPHKCVPFTCFRGILSFEVGRSVMTLSSWTQHLYNVCFNQIVHVIIIIQCIACHLYILPICAFRNRKTIIIIIKYFRFAF